MVSGAPEVRESFDHLSKENFEEQYVCGVANTPSAFGSDTLGLARKAVNI
jgi:hypothetical protein